LRLQHHLIVVLILLDFIIFQVEKERWLEVFGDRLDRWCVPASASLPPRRMQDVFESFR